MTQNIREVWDYQLSKATPLIDRSGGTWVVKIFAKNQPDFDPKDPSTLSAPLKQHDTKIPWEDNDEHDNAKLEVCYSWLREARDEFSYPDIEERKPALRRLRELQALVHLSMNSKTLSNFAMNYLKRLSNEAGSLYASEPTTVFTLPGDFVEEVGEVLNHVPVTQPIVEALLEEV